jgi:putative transcriptional regulator
VNAKLDTQQAMKKLDISKSMLYKMEQGFRKPSRDLIKKMSDVNGCSVEEIFSALDVTNSDERLAVCH